MIKPPQSKRSRNAEDTRRAILESARIAFTLHGYEKIGIREITRLVGVNGSLVNRYFGSKKALFAEAMTVGMGLGVGLDIEWSEAVGSLAAMVLDRDGVDRDIFDPILTLIRSASNLDAQPVLRDYLCREAIHPLSNLIGGDGARDRASLVVAFLLGIILLRAVIKTEGFAETKRDDLATLIERLMRAAADPSSPRNPWSDEREFRSRS